MRSPGLWSFGSSARVSLPLTARALFSSAAAADPVYRVHRGWTGDQTQYRRDMRRRHRRALEHRVALALGESSPRREAEARYLERPVRARAERREGGGEVVQGVREARRAAAVGARQIEFARPARCGDVDARAVVAVVRQLVIFALTAGLVRDRFSVCRRPGRSRTCSAKHPRLAARRRRSPSPRRR